jgi:tetratricopeptide (TPR) repeat protein
MPKLALTLLFFLSGFTGFAQQTTLKEWKHLAANDINLLPEYGNKPKTNEQILADKQFIELCIKQDGNAQEASKHLVRLGFSYLYKADLKTAMKRFNQAWLLNNHNVECYWGFGDVYRYLNDLGEALIQYHNGLKIDPYHAQLLSNIGNVNYDKYIKGGDKPTLDQAIIFLNKAIKSDSSNLSAAYTLSHCHFIKHNCSQAIKFYYIFKASGGKDKDAFYADALKRHCKMK